MMKLGTVAVLFAAVVVCLLAVSCGEPDTDDRRSGSRQREDRGDESDPLVIVVRGERLDLSHLDLSGRDGATALYAELQAAVKRIEDAASIEENDTVRQEELNASVAEQDGAANHARETLQSAEVRLADLIEQQKAELKANPPHDFPFDDPPLKVNSHVIDAAKRAVDEAELLVRLSKKGDETILAPLRAEIEQIDANRLSRNEAIANDKTTIARLEDALLELAHHNS